MPPVELPRKKSGLNSGNNDISLNRLSNASVFNFCCDLVNWKLLKKKSAVYPSDNLLFWTNAKKILTVISFIGWENSRNFPIGWSLLQPISTNNRDLGGVASSVCFFLPTFLRRHFAWMASRNVGCYRRLYLPRFPVVVIVFLLSFLFALLADVTFAFLCFYRNRQRTQTHWPRLSWICWLISLVGQIKKQKVS